ncbi:hypothetical protein, partial [Nocardia higoensis]|uniref:hypothetical protein n=1 Tax=Nocardia higoensis TaxID=228599 RepID=UPI000592F11C
PVSAGPGEAVLVIDDRGQISWWSGRAAAVPAVDLRLGPGITGRIDPAAPHRLLSWALEPGAAPDPLGAALADPELADLVTILRTRGEAVYALDCPDLTQPWRERARIAAVARWTMRPVHHGALLIDRAVAEHATGELVAAGRLFRHAEYAFAQLGERCLDGELSASAVELLRTATPAAAVHGLTGAAAELTAALDDAEIVDVAALLDAVRRWSVDIDTPGAVPVAATLGGEIPQNEVDQVHLDPTVLPPRILSWQGARTPELRVEHLPDADAFRLGAHLAAGVDPLCREVADLLAYAADRETGALLAVTATTVEGRLVVAELPAGGRDSRTVHFGLFSADIAPAALRADPVGRGLVDVDRAMIEAWNQHRTALVTLASVPADAPEPELAEARLRCEEHLLLAESAALDAQGIVAGMLEQPGIEDANPRGMLTARHSAVQAYLDALRAPEVAADPLTLTELIPPDAETDR